MGASAYPVWVKTIEAIRLANYRRLVREIQGDQESIGPPDVARALGISTVYAWQLGKGKRDKIDSKAARLMEREAGKPEGWMDTDFDMWPFPDKALLARLEKLDEPQRTEIQGVLKERLDRYESNVSTPGKLSGSSSIGSPRQAA
jgi:hypothetical protein